jgi:capsule biosynthesis phosphatase
VRICIDIDGVIADFKKSGESYADCKLVSGARNKIKMLFSEGHYIILYTARHMKTCNGNAALALSRIGKTTLDWLEKNEVPYHEIHFGKPWADVYIDDNALRFSGWDHISGDGNNLPISNEKSRQSK